MTMDPVCGMEVRLAAGVPRSVYRGRVHFFCSYDCKHLFDAEPRSYATEDAWTIASRT